MVKRLVLEWGLPQRVLAEYTHAIRGTLQVISHDAELVESLRESAVPVIAADPTDPAVLKGVDEPDVVVAAARSLDRNIDIADVANEEFPDATLIALVRFHGSPEQQHRLEEIADRTFDGRDAVLAEFLNVANTPGAIRVKRVRSVMKEIEGELAIFTHDNPDPDAIASASALKQLANRLGTPAKTYYYGEITHQSNRAFINVFDLSPTQLKSGEMPPETGGVALVDHAIPGMNDSLPPDLPVDLIFDHHTPGGPVDARYVDLRESVGATSTIMAEYLRNFGLEPEPSLASALVYGIRTDTRDFSRQTSIEDFDAAAGLWPLADHDALNQIANPSLSTETIGTIAHAIEHRRVEGPVLSSCVGILTERDALGQAADLLLQMEGISVAMVYGVIDGAIEASARSRTQEIPIDLATIMREAFTPIGSAGGHEQMAGARIPLGILAEGDDGNEEEMITIVSEVVDDRFLETIRDYWGLDFQLEES